MIILGIIIGGFAGVLLYKSPPYGGPLTGLGVLFGALGGMLVGLVVFLFLSIAMIFGFSQKNKAVVDTFTEGKDIIIVRLPGPKNSWNGYFAVRIGYETAMNMQALKTSRPQLNGRSVNIIPEEIDNKIFTSAGDSNAGEQSVGIFRSTRLI